MASTSSSEPPPVAEAEERNWLELPPDVMATILHKVGAIDILENAQKVCTTWRRICKEPAMWRVIDMDNSIDLNDMELEYDTAKMAKLAKMAMHAVDRSCGQLVDINIVNFGTNELIEYIADRSSQLRRLQYVRCRESQALSEAVKKLPLLEELHIYYTHLSKESIETIGRRCPRLKSFKLNKHGFRCPHIECNEEAVAIAENMPHLRHLQLFGNKITNVGLQAILDGCPHLESLDLRQCFNINLEGNLAKRCSEQIKCLRRPCDSTEDYEFDAEIIDSESFDEDYPSGISDIDFYSGDEEYYEFSDYDDFSV